MILQHLVAQLIYQQALTPDDFTHQERAFGRLTSGKMVNLWEMVNWTGPTVSAYPSPLTL